MERGTVPKDFVVESIPTTPFEEEPPANHHTEVPLPATGQLGLAARLRNATAQVHQEVQQPQVVLDLVGGKLAQPIHLRYLYMLHSIYHALELGLDRNRNNSALAGSYKPALLARTAAIEGDLQYFTEKMEGQYANWQESEVSIELQRNRVQELQDYVDRLELLARDESQAYLLLAHAYVRYLGDLSGGQYIARTLRKSYSLPSSGEGSAFYEFFTDKVTPSGLPERAGPEEVKVIKEWFRDELDSAGEGLSEEQRVAVIQEAKDAFKFNIGVFSTFEPIVAKWNKDHPAAAQIANATTTATASATKGGRPEVASTDTNKLTFFGVALLAGLGAYLFMRGSPPVVEF